MKLWAGRFQKETDDKVNDFNSSISFDARLYRQDIAGSIAHATMLGEQGIIAKEEADKIVTEFGRKVDALADKVTTKMAEIEAGLSGQVADIRKTSEEQIALNRRMNEEQTASNRKLNEEQIAANKQFLEEQAIANKKLSEGQIAEVKELLENATSQLESIKTDLSEKVHTENVKCYRNIQDLFNEFDSKIEKMDEMEGGVDSVKGYVKLLSWFSILNFVVLIIFILYSMGVFHF